MRVDLIKIISLLLLLLLSCSLYSQRYGIKVELINSQYPYLTLISLESDSIIFEKSYVKERKYGEKSSFLFAAPQGNYVLCISNGAEFEPVFIQVELRDRALNLGEIELKERSFMLPPNKGGFRLSMTTYWAEWGNTFMINSKESIQYILSPYGKRWNLFNFLCNGIISDDLRISEETKQISDFMLDNVPLEMNAMELSVFLKSMSTHNVVYITKTMPSENHPRGLVEIITEASYEDGR